MSLTVPVVCAKQIVLPFYDLSFVQQKLKIHAKFMNVNVQIFSAAWLWSVALFSV